MTRRPPRPRPSSTLLVRRYVSVCVCVSLSLSRSLKTSPFFDPARPPVLSTYLCILIRLWTSCKRTHTPLVVCVCVCVCVCGAWSDCVTPDNARDALIVGAERNREIQRKTEVDAHIYARARTHTHTQMIGGKGETEVHVRAVCLAGGKGFTYSDEGSVTYTLTGPFLCVPAYTKIYALTDKARWFSERCPLESFLMDVFSIVLSEMSSRSRSRTLLLYTCRQICSVHVGDHKPTHTHTHTHTHTWLSDEAT